MQIHLYIHMYMCNAPSPKCNRSSSATMSAVSDRPLLSSRMSLNLKNGASFGARSVTHNVTYSDCEMSGEIGGGILAKPLAPVERMRCLRWRFLESQLATKETQFKMGNARFWKILSRSRGWGAFAEDFSKVNSLLNRPWNMRNFGFWEIFSRSRVRVATADDFSKVGAVVLLCGTFGSELSMCVFVCIVFVSIYLCIYIYIYIYMCIRSLAV